MGECIFRWVSVDVPDLCNNSRERWNPLRVKSPRPRTFVWVSIKRPCHRRQKDRSTKTTTTDTTTEQPNKETIKTTRIKNEK